jgi:hypothetical protein
MSVSAVATPVPVKTPDVGEPKGPGVKADSDAGSSRTPQPTILAALPPGQGTRINQLA